MIGRFDVIAIGEDGTAAAALLAQRGLRVLQIRHGDPDPAPGALLALDPRLVEQLHLVRHGLGFLQRDLASVILRDEAAPLILPRDRHAAARALDNEADARTWPLVRQRLFARARALRRWWEQDQMRGGPADILKRSDMRAAFDWLQWAGADAWSASHFESDALRSLLVFDAVAGGSAPSEPGTALALVWRAAQEMAGLQGALALPKPGSLEGALRAAARRAGVESAYGRVARIAMDEGRATAVVLADGQAIRARVFLSALPRIRTLALMGLPATGETAPVGQARVLLTLTAAHGLAAARYVLAGSAGHQADAYEAARAGRLIADPPLSFVPLDDRQLTVTLRPVPVAGFDRARLAAHAVKAMARHVPGLARRLGAVTVTPPVLGATRASLTRLIAPAGTRAATPAANVFLCGPDAEPVACISGRACRLAAGFALRIL